MCVVPDIARGDIEVFAKRFLLTIVLLSCLLAACGSVPDTRNIIAGISLDNLGKKWSDGMDMSPVVSKISQVYRQRFPESKGKSVL